jgi:hypothetical protein
VRVAKSPTHGTCAALLAILLASAQLLSSAHADTPPAKPAKLVKHKAKLKRVQKAALYAVSAPALKGLGTALVEPTPEVLATLAEQFVPHRVHGADLDTQLRRANEEHPVQFTLYEHLKLEWQLKSYPTAERFPDVGMKVGVRYRF